MGNRCILANWSTLPITFPNLEDREELRIVNELRIDDEFGIRDELRFDDELGIDVELRIEKLMSRELAMGTVEWPCH